MNAQDVLSRYAEARQLYSIRDKEFIRIENYLMGIYSDEIQQGTYLRDEAKYQTLAGTTMVVANDTYYTVRDNVSLVTKDPIIEVPPKTDKNEKQSLKIQKILYGTYEHSGGIQLIHDSALYEHAYGYSVIGAVPNLLDKRIDWVVYNPKYCYPVFEMGNKVFLRELIVRWQESPRAIKDAYPDWTPTGDSEDEIVDVTVYYSKTHKLTVVGDVLVSGVKHDWGFVPFVIVPCQPTVDGTGIGDVHQNVGITLAKNRLIGQIYKYVEENVNADTALFSDDDMVAPFEFGGKVFWKFSRESQTKTMEPSSGNMGEAFRLLQELQSMYGGLSGTSSARMGQREGMYVSSKGQAALQQPLGNQLDSAQRIKAERMSLLCEYTLRLYEKHFANTELDLYGRIGRSYFDITFKGKDIKGYYRTHIRWLPVILNDESNKQIIGLQLLQNGIISKYTYTSRFLSDVIDPGYEEKQIREEQFEDTKLEAAKQQILMMSQQLMQQQQQQQQLQMQMQQQQLMQQQQQQPQQQPQDIPTVNPYNAHENNPVLPAAKENYALEKGAMSVPESAMPGNMSLGQSPVPALDAARPVAQGPANPLQLLQGGNAESSGSGMPMAAPSLVDQSRTIPEDIGANLIRLEDVADAIRTVKRIKGQVYLSGIIVITGSVDVDNGQKITIALSYQKDQQTIVNVLKQYAGYMDFVPVESVSGPMVEVTPGTQGYEPSNTSAPEAQMPMEAQQQMTGKTSNGGIPNESY